MIQNYEITASLNGEIHKMTGSIESKNGANEKDFKILCRELKLRFPQYENFKVYLEGELIYKN